MYKGTVLILILLLATAASAAPLRMMLTTQAVTAAEGVAAVSGKPGPDWCWDASPETGGRYVKTSTTLSCTKGGTRMCDKGKWRVLNGACTAVEMLDEDGNSVINVFMPNPNSAPTKKP